MIFSNSFSSADDFEFLFAEGEMLNFRKFKAMNAGVLNYNSFSTTCTEHKQENKFRVPVCVNSPESGSTK